MAFTCWGGNIYFITENKHHDYTYLNNQPGISFVNFAKFFLHFRMMIPLEAIVIIEVCRFLFAKLVDSDALLYHEGSGNNTKV